MRTPSHARRWAILGATLVALAACGQSVPATSPPPSSLGSPATGPSPSSATGVTPSAVPPPATSPAAPRFSAVRSAIRLPAGRSRAVAVVLGSDLLVCGGLTGAGTTSSILRIDLATGAVSPFGTLARAVHDAGGAVLSGSAYVFGGGSSVAEATIQRFGPTGASTQVGQLPVVRADLVAVAVAGEIVIVGGGTPAGPDGRILATTDGIHLRTIGRLLVPVRYPAVAVLDGIVYVLGGATAAGDTTTIQAVDPGSGSVRLVGRLPRALSHGSGLVVAGAILVAGGRSAGVAQAELWRLDPTTGGVSSVGRLPYAISDAAAVVAGGRGELIGGETSSPVATVITVTGT